MNLSTFWKKKIKVSIILKSGKEIIIHCRKFDWTTSGNSIESYSIEGATPIPKFIKIDEIAAIVTY